ncbi:MAG: protein-ADP-ribose hydrolase [Eubacteriales bacterium]
MTQSGRIAYLLDYFLSETPENQNIAVPLDEEGQKEILRGLINLRPPHDIPEEVLTMEDAFLQTDLEGKVVPFSSMTPKKGNIYLWQGDITKLEIDGIVNAANSDMLGCFYPCHKCIDNAIHTFSGIRLRLACHELMEKQGRPEATGCAKITPAYNLPSKYVLHTVGPIVHGGLEEYHREALERSYRSCLFLASEQKLEALAFCCISTGEFHFPQEEACNIAINVVEDYIEKVDKNLKVLFNVFKEEDLKLYEEKLRPC